MSESLWKSTFNATGGFGCERATLYRERVRDPKTGYRLDFGMPERVLFGIGVDMIVRRALTEEDESDADPPGVSPIRARLAIDAAQKGYEKARARQTAEPWTEDDWRTFREGLMQAAAKFVGVIPNRKAEPEGTPPGPPIDWIPRDGLELQTKLLAPDVVGGRGVSGMPDLVWRTPNGALGRVIEGWCDVKAPSRQGSYPAKWIESEAVTYDYLCTVENSGIPPAWHAYLEYVRVKEPYWQLRTADVDPASLTLARAYFSRWERALDGDIDAVSFSPKACGTCDFRDAIPDAGHAGCSIGQSVAHLTEAPDG